MAKPLPPELNEHFLEGLRLFDAGRYHAAHDEIEELWLDEVGDVKRALQGLIQLAVGLYHRTRGNLRGAAKLFGRSADIFAGLPAQLLSLDLCELESRALALKDEIERTGGFEAPAEDPELVPDFRGYRERMLERRRARGLPDPAERPRAPDDPD